MLDLVATAQDSEVTDLAETCEELVTLVVRHFVAEEQYLYPLVRRSLDDGDQLSAAAFDEHDDVEHRLRRLEDTDRHPATARPILDDVSAALRRHVAQQDQQVFIPIRATVDATELRALADQIIGAEQLAPTRPRLVRLESPTANKVVSLVAGFVDHVRDFYGHRGIPDPDAEDSR